ncbi:MAG: hypothetical protein IPP27_08405 [Bacteroidetes bacterium]|nr:hypothetical protein [Bacteroidota bacterium]
MLNKIIIGDYSVAFGQGLTAWSGPGFRRMKISSVFVNQDEDSALLPLLMKPVSPWICS